METFRLRCSFICSASSIFSCESNQKVKTKTERGKQAGKTAAEKFDGPKAENRRTSHGRVGGKLRKDNCETKCQSQTQTATQTLMKFRSNFVGEQKGGREREREWGREKERVLVCG